METLLIKIGTNALTDQKGRLDYNVIKNLAEQMAKLHRERYAQILVTSGAVGAGQEVLNVSENNKIVRKQILAAVGQSRLMHVYTQEFAKFRITVAQALLMRSDFADRQRYLNIKKALQGLLDNKAIPIINENDVVATTELEISDNDTIAVLTASLADAKKIIMLTDIDGFYDRDPARGKGAQLIPYVENITAELEKKCAREASRGGRGGFIAKLRAAKFAAQIGIEFYVVNGKSKNIILDVMKNNFVGTKFAAQEKKISGLRQWLFLGARGGGAIQIDAGAYTALQDKKSLLVVGVRKVLGGFKTKEVINIFDEQMVKVAAGVVNYDSQELEKLIKKENKRDLREVVHCDNVVVF